MKFRTAALLTAALTLGLAACDTPGPVVEASAVTPQEAYAGLVHRQYAAAHRDALALQAAVDAFVAQPSEVTLAAAKQAWLGSRESYGLTEAHRFYDGPIDGVNEATGEEGPEGQLNSWPLNEAYLDYVQGSPEAGLVNDPAADLSAAALAAGNQVTDESDVTTGYHAVEFLLWGQDLSLDGPGVRPVTDYTAAANAGRRGTLLKVTTRLLVDDLAGLVAAWAPSGANYRAAFVARPLDGVLADLLSAQATLAGFELASERIGVALDSGDQEDEHSCFSDNTHRDFVQNIGGIAAVWGAGVGDAVAARDAVAAAHVADALSQAQALAQQVETLGPVDTILAAEAGTPGRVALEGLSEQLVVLAETLVEAGTAAGLKVEIGGE